MSINIVIPARYQSKRLQGKVLLEIAKKTMLQHVYERAVQAQADKVIIATDNQEVFDVATNFGAKVCMTSSLHESGTERIAEVIDIFNFDKKDIIVNVQADEPLIPTSIINQVVRNLKYQKEANISTLCVPIKKIEDVFDPNVTKVVLDNNGYAIYFSHAPIPWYRDGFSRTKKTLPPKFPYYRHIGLYAYYADFVKKYAELVKSPLENIEALEQLRILWSGERIHVDVAEEEPGPSVDTKEDLDLVRKIVGAK